ncbi:Undecaprenyl diphosphate synthase [Xylona heveae TC161]|uniref:ditrans,polycis-polyprenyl diphosphate synthase [(2E,6E)-farnesyldiphosphate specific] n=1 Tax=Xylona heveae (strain CBS 132557 / TC161) TaxID=1328760 RepID=A0A165II33_XYLHT|nr:Undecaprenyl diphosphate synthase [Xylona heveae TC161]KZF24932.1 Undecaprenyl diphosphate synthase [Xylona heveae TC161]
MVGVRETEIYRRDARREGSPLTAKQREELLRPYLPSPPPQANTVSRKQRGARAVSEFFRIQLYVLVYTLIHTFFGLYMRLRQWYHAVLYRIFAVLYYHHRTPQLIQKDVKGLSRLPEHLSVILEYNPEEKGGEGLEQLIEEIAEIAAWSACAGIPLLSVYEKTGILKSYIPTTHRAIAKRLQAYFGTRRPSLQLRAPHLPAFLNGDLVDESHSDSNQDGPGHLSVLLLSAEDGRSTMVDLTKTLTEMSQRSKLSPNDISVDLVDVEIRESTMAEPDLLILFGPDVELQGYPPWQIRLTEIFHVPDNTGVEYQIFLRALYRFGKAQMRFGR